MDFNKQPWKWTALINNTKCSSQLLNPLVAKGHLAPIEIEKLKRVGDREGEMEQANELYNYLMTRTNAYSDLIEILETPHVSQKEPAKILKSGYELYEIKKHKIVDIVQETALPVESVMPDSLESETDYYVKHFIQRPLIVELDMSLPDADTSRKIQDTTNYNLPESNRGWALIINIVNFDKYVLQDGEYPDGNEPKRTRYGASVDGQHMRDIWKTLGYKIFREDEIDWEDGVWYKQQIQNMLKDFKEFCKKRRPNSIVVFLGSHGEHDKIYTSDAPVTRKQIWNESNQPSGFDYEHVKLDVFKDIVGNFYHASCPELIGRPKLFFVNACQVFRAEQSDNIAFLPVSDMTVVTSQAPGFKSWRNPTRGSWFVHCLTCVLMKYARQKTFQEMLEMVVGIMKNLDKRTGKMQLADGTFVDLPHGQIPVPHEMGLEAFYFILKPRA